MEGSCPASVGAVRTKGVDSVKMTIDMMLVENGLALRSAFYMSSQK